MRTVRATSDRPMRGVRSRALKRSAVVRGSCDVVNGIRAIHVEEHWYDFCLYGLITESCMMKMEAITRKL